MFIAKFTQTSNAPFTADKNGNFPFIGDVLAGQHTGSIINGTMFNREGLEANVLYACENSVDPEYPTNVQTTVVSKLTIKEYLELKTMLGAPKKVTATATSTANTEDINV